MRHNPNIIFLIYIMKKAINITEKAIPKKRDAKRKVSKKWESIPEINDSSKHVNLINRIFLNDHFNGENYIISELKKKLNGYKSQDIDKKMYSENEFINYENLLELLVKSKLNCYYCKCKMLLMYNNVRDKQQWTLDRIDNSIGHNNENLVISCLECNLKRRRLDSDKFKFTKQMKIVKTF